MIIISLGLKCRTIERVNSYRMNFSRTLIASLSKTLSTNEASPWALGQVNLRAWQRQASKAESTLADTHSVELLQQERTMLISRMDDLANAYIRYVT